MEAVIRDRQEDYYRVLAVAMKALPEQLLELNFSDVDEGLVFLGLCGLIDPPRPEAIEAVTVCQRAGIRVKMITGDHRVTAMAIARQVGLVNADNMGDEDRAEANNGYMV